MLDVEQTIVSQYGNSSTIGQLIQNMNEYIDPRTDFNTFFDFVWNVDTAQGFGLDVWGRIVNVSRVLKIPEDPLYFGFSQASPGSYPFDEQPFYSGIEAATQSYLLSDDAYRQLIFTKALVNISNCTAQTINQLLQNLFATRGKCYVNDLGNMSMRYVFEFVLSPYELAIIAESGVMPRPVGVSATLIQSDFPVFGFSEAGDCAPFGQAPFISESAIYAVS